MADTKIVASPVKLPTKQAVADARVAGKDAVLESKGDKFRRLANRRVPRAVKALDAVRNLANVSQYEYTPEQRAAVISALSDALAAVRIAFEGRKDASATWRI